MESTGPFFDTYKALPFRGYRSAAQPLGDECTSLMHFVESEKYRGIDESYRQYVLSLTDKEDFFLETVGIGQAVVRPDWNEVRSSLITAGLWMQLFQRPDDIGPFLMDPNCQTGIRLIDNAAQSVYQRLCEASDEGNGLRRVVLAGDLNITDKEVFSVFDQLFSTRLPDEIIVTTEAGIADLAHQYSLMRYIPVRCLPHQASDLGDAVSLALIKGTHVFLMAGADSSDSAFAEGVFELAKSQGKIAHRIHWGS